MSLIERVQALFSQKEISSDLKDGGTEVMTFISNGIVGSRLAVAEIDGMVRCAVLIPIYTPSYRRTEMAVAISKANWCLIGRSFRIDHSDGEVRYECYLPVLDGTVTDEQLCGLSGGHGLWPAVTSRPSWKWRFPLPPPRMRSAGPMHRIRRS